MQLHTILITLPPDESTTHGVGVGGGGKTESRQRERVQHMGR